MPRYVAFLRAVNIGGRVVKMDRLRATFEGMGLSNVRTYIASGNVIFDARSRNSANIEAGIEKVLEKALGYEVATFVRGAEELIEVAEHRPFSESELSAAGHGLYVAFLRGEPSASCVKALMGRRSEFDDFHVRGREVYWLCRGRFSESPTSSLQLEKLLQCQATVRNSTTVRKVVDGYLRAAD